MAGVPSSFSSATTQIGGFLSKKPYASSSWATHLPPPHDGVSVDLTLRDDGEDGAWCVCRTDLADSPLQKTLDYAFGGGADCKPILQNGGCFAPDTVKAHCSYAVNSFYQRNNQNPQACVFSGTAELSNNDPSENQLH